MDVCTGTGSVSHEEIVVDDSRRCPLCAAIKEQQDGQGRIEELEKEVSDREEEITSLRGEVNRLEQNQKEAE